MNAERIQGVWEGVFLQTSKKKSLCNRLSVGVESSSEGTFPSPALQPRHQGLSVKDVLTVSSRLSQPLSCLSKVSYASSIPFCCLFCTLFNTEQTDALDLSFKRGLTGLISSLTEKRGEFNNANLAQWCKYTWTLMNSQCKWLEGLSCFSRAETLCEGRRQVHYSLKVWQLVTLPD